MKLRRIAATVSAGFEDALSRIENHEAVAETALQDLRKSVAQIAVQRRRAEAEVERLQVQQSSAVKAQADWQQRALAVAAEDEPRALQCLARAETAATQEEELGGQIAAHQALVDELGATLERAQAQLQTLSLKKSALSARDVHSRSLREVDAVTTNPQVQDVFDRWETQVLAEEAGVLAQPHSADAFERAFLAEEEQLRLRAKLDRILDAQSPNDEASR